MEDLPCNLQDFKDLLLTCQIPQDIFRGVRGSMPRWVRDVLAAERGPAKNKEGLIMCKLAYLIPNQIVTLKKYF